MHPLWASCHHLVQQLSQPPLSEVSDRGSRKMDRGASKGTAPHALYARGLHTSSPLGATGAAEQEDPLRSAVPYQCGNPSRGGTRPATSRCRTRLLQCVTHVESAAPHPSARPLRHSRRGSLARSHPLDSLPRKILPAKGSAA